MLRSGRGLATIILASVAAVFALQWGQSLVTAHILDDINESIRRYMFMLLATNVLVGLLTWIALSWGDLENAGAWAAPPDCCMSSRILALLLPLPGLAWRPSCSSIRWRRRLRPPGFQW